MNRRVFYFVSAAAVCVSCPSSLIGDWYDDFSDESYWQGEQDPNDPCDWFDPNRPPKERNRDPDPNLWDIDNPHWLWELWSGQILLVEPPYSVSTEYADRPLRLYVQHVLLYPILAAWVDDGVDDANLSAAHWDDMTNHYMVCKAWNSDAHVRSGDPCDPNGDRGCASLWLRLHPASWTAYVFQLDFDAQTRAGDDPDHAHTFHLHFDAAGYFPAVLKEIWLDPNDTRWVDVDDWERQGFWMLFQFESRDPNYGAGDPNGKWLCGGIWTGDKYEWDGNYVLAVDLGSPGLPSHSYPDGLRQVGVSSRDDSVPVADVAYDDFEVRTGVFTPNSHRLTVYLPQPALGTFTVDPRLPDPNDPQPGSPYLFRYTEGSLVVVEAVPYEGVDFLAWIIHDPNDPTNPNRNVGDYNQVLYLRMDQEWYIDPWFESDDGCAEEAMLVLLPMMLALGLAALVRRLR